MASSSPCWPCADDESANAAKVKAAAINKRKRMSFISSHLRAFNRNARADHSQQTSTLGSYRSNFDRVSSARTDDPSALASKLLERAGVAFEEVDGFVLNQRESCAPVDADSDASTC